MPTVFSHAERERAKAQARETETVQYIHLLEQVARAADVLWFQLGEPNEKAYANALYEALERVDFLKECDERKK